MAGLLPRVDRLTLDGAEPVEVQDEEADVEMPEEELLRLDDGTRLPAELAELRTLLELHSTSSVFDGDDVDDASRNQMAALQVAKAEALRDCLLGFDEGILLLHDKLLDHEALCKRLDMLRKCKRAAPVGKFRYDEEVVFDDDAANAVGHSEDSALDLSDLLSIDTPGGVVSDGRGGAAVKATTDSAEDDADDQEEALDQRVAASRQQIKAWLRALEEGKHEKAPTGRVAAAIEGRAAAAAEGRPGGPIIARAPTELAPVVPPPRARQSSFSHRLRAQTMQWNARSGR